MVSSKVAFFPLMEIYRLFAVVIPKLPWRKKLKKPSPCPLLYLGLILFSDFHVIIRIILDRGVNSRLQVTH